MVKKILLMGALCLSPIFIYYLFFSYERFETGPHQLSNPKYGTYVYVGTADQVEYAEKLGHLPSKQIAFFHRAKFPRLFLFYVYECKTLWPDSSRLKRLRYPHFRHSSSTASLLEKPSIS